MFQTSQTLGRFKRLFLVERPLYKSEIIALTIPFTRRRPTSPPSWWWTTRPSLHLLLPVAVFPHPLRLSFGAAVIVDTASAASSNRLQVGISFFFLLCFVLFHLTDVVAHLFQQQHVQVLLIIRSLVIVLLVTALAPLFLLLLFLLVLLPLFLGLLNLNKWETFWCLWGSTEQGILVDWVGLT